jgi:hypothetical protein
VAELNLSDVDKSVLKILVASEAWPLIKKLIAIYGEIQLNKGVALDPTESSDRLRVIHVENGKCVRKFVSWVESQVTQLH